MIAPPTWEEAPISLTAWLAQRTRWIKGHMQTWLVLMRDPLRTVRESGMGAFLSMQLVLGAGAAAALLHAPLALLLLIALATPYGLLTPADIALAAAGYGAAFIAALRASGDARNLDHARAALTMPFYWPISMISALRALAGLASRPHSWTKTAHGVSLRTQKLPRTPKRFV